MHIEAVGKVEIPPQRKGIVHTGNPGEVSCVTEINIFRTLEKF